MTQAAVFDLDGTLLDTPAAIARTLAAVLTGLGRPAPCPADARATVGLPLDRALPMLAGGPMAADEVATGVATYVELFRESVLPTAADLVFPDVAAGLDRLRRSGTRLAVATSKFTPNATALLRSAGLLDHFDVVVGADQVRRPKPDPEMGRLVLSLLDVAAEDAVMVGDTTHDVRMAHGAGMASVAVTYGVHDRATLAAAEPTWTADSFAEVVTCCRMTWRTTRRRPS